ncbi:MAG: hypothetical protein WC120_05220 [Parcubacteria group bacterium]|jgi:hypothetical protein
MENRKPCGHCGGDGKLFKYVSLTSATNRCRRVFDRNCDRCNGTGKVWPSVADEQVIVFPSSESDSGGDRIYYVGIGAIEVQDPGRYRVIIQPLPSPSERRESEGGRE